MTYVHTRVIIRGDTPVAAGGQTTPNGGRILSFDVGEPCNDVSMQGDPEVLLAFVDRVRAELLAVVAEQFPDALDQQAVA